MSFLIPETALDTPEDMLDTTLLLPEKTLPSLPTVALLSSTALPELSTNLPSTYLVPSLGVKTLARVCWKVLAI